ncbi:unnamed protein product [Auanema sp. JU1783]|nr:unnamed protein product [Auanema sp. JU1783]
MRWSRLHNRLAVLFIMCACTLSVYALIKKIQRVFYFNHLDENAELVGTISSLLYYNSSFTLSGSPSLNFLIHSSKSWPDDIVCESRNSTYTLQSRLQIENIGPNTIKQGICESVDNPMYFNLFNEELSLAIEPDVVKEKPSLSSNTVCITYALLYEDVSSIRTIMRHFIGKRVVFYGGSWNDDVMYELRQNSKDIEMIFWPLIRSEDESSKNEDPSQFSLHVDSYTTTLYMSLADCWFRYAPVSETVTFVHLNNIIFSGSHPLPPPALGSTNSLFKHITDSWKLQKLNTVKIIDNNKLSLTISELCHSRNVDVNCIPMSSSHFKLMPRQLKQTTLKKSSSSFFGQDNYDDIINRCAQSNDTMYGEDFDRPILEHDLIPQKFKIASKVDPCEINLRKSNYQCRSATQYMKRLFSKNRKVNVVLKRALLRHTDGCHI